MKYRKLGRTGLEVSEVSVGTEWLEKKSPELITSVIRKAIENGVNYFDIIFNFEEHLTKVSKAIEGYRDKIVLVHHLGSSEYKGKYKKNRSIKSCTNTFEKYLEIIKTDYVDILYVHFVLGPTNFEEKILIANEASKALNPAFDITPPELITGYITSKGILNLDLLKDVIQRIKKAE